MGMAATPLRRLSSLGALAHRARPPALPTVCGAMGLCVSGPCSPADVPLPARFLSMLEEEIYGENSPIWEADFTVPATEGAQLVSRPGISGSSPPSLGAVG